MGRWDGLCSRDASSRAEAMEFISQEVMRKVEAIGPIKAANRSSPAPGSPPNSDLNGILVQLLMLSRRCPFEDVRERCAQLLQDIQFLNSKARNNRERARTPTLTVTVPSASQQTPSSLLILLVP
ncbi:hypothetical protein CHARACLAT_000089 [Characodon lateralis]|uniref:Uncharacterized protein n=1 Tax=Characodon lateralis TaxID=208331 RepID=A0ABU7CK46_9TELE|nr:hypothetical protein [Characodon lateralis]